MKIISISLLLASCLTAQLGFSTQTAEPKRFFQDQEYFNYFADILFSEPQALFKIVEDFESLHEIAFEDSHVTIRLLPSEIQEFSEVLAFGEDIMTAGEDFILNGEVPTDDEDESTPNPDKVKFIASNTINDKELIALASNAREFIAAIDELDLFSHKKISDTNDWIAVPSEIIIVDLDSLNDHLDLIEKGTYQSAILPTYPKLTILIKKPPFEIQKGFVTNKEYYKFALATKHAFPKHWNNSKYPKGTDNQPAVNITYKDAEDYAAWSRGRLPTKKELSYSLEKSSINFEPNHFEWTSTESEINKFLQDPERISFDVSSNNELSKTDHHCDTQTGFRCVR